MMDEKLFADGPARDSRFDVKERWSETQNFPPDHREHRLEFLHRQMNEEVCSIEMSARNLTDFPDADWELRMAMARQCWDESRHFRAFRRLFESRGGRIGQYPVLSFQYRIITKIDTLAGRLAVQNRSFEAAGIDALEHELANYDRAADPEYAELFEMQLADEMQHVRYGNEWVRKLTAQGGARTVFDVARAVSHASLAFKDVLGESGAGVYYPVATDARREAGFDDREIEAARQMAGQPPRT